MTAMTLLLGIGTGLFGSGIVLLLVKLVASIKGWDYSTPWWFSISLLVTGMMLVSVGWVGG